jgi:hypothetical protein
MDSEKQARELLVHKRALQSCISSLLGTDSKHLVNACSEAVAALKAFQRIAPVAALDDEIGIGPLLLKDTNGR